MLLSGIPREVKVRLKAQCGISSRHKKYCAYPQHFPVARKNQQRAVFRGKYPYSLIFVEDEDAVRVYAGAHAKRGSEYWKKRQF
jgi:hypothetical protein